MRLHGRTSEEAVLLRFIDENAEDLRGKCPSPARSGRKSSSGLSAPPRGL